MLSVVTIEGALRLLGLAGMVVFTPSPVWGFLMTPTQKVFVYGHPVTINAHGFRGDEISAPKPPGVRRLVFIGDSVTYGGGRVSDEQLFTELVAARLSGPGAKVELSTMHAVKLVVCRDARTFRGRCGDSDPAGV